MQSEFITAVLNSIPEPIFVLTRAGVYLNVLGGSDRSRYHDARDLIGKKISDIIHGPVAEEFLGKIDESIETGQTVLYSYSLEDSSVEGNEKKEGPKGKQWYEAHISPVIEEDGSSDKVIWIAFNITRLSNIIKVKEEEGKLFEKLANFDPLTGLYNRRSFFHEGDRGFSAFLNEEISHLSVIMIDMDYFKSINDRYGHQAGDTVLTSFAAHVGDFLREDDFIGRLGGEEFAVLFRNKDISVTEEIAQRLRSRIEAMDIQFEEAKLEVTASIGVSEVLKTDNSIKDSLKRADEALYQAKTGGRNRVVVKGKQATVETRRGT